MTVVRVLSVRWSAITVFCNVQLNKETGSHFGFHIIIVSVCTGACTRHGGRVVLQVILEFPHLSSILPRRSLLPQKAFSSFFWLIFTLRLQSALMRPSFPPPPCRSVTEQSRPRSCRRERCSESALRRWETSRRLLVALKGGWHDCGLLCSTKRLQHTKKTKKKQENKTNTLRHTCES